MSSIELYFSVYTCRRVCVLYFLFFLCFIFDMKNYSCQLDKDGRKTPEEKFLSKVEEKGA